MTVRRKQSQNIPILGAGADDAAGAVFSDTPREGAMVKSGLRIIGNVFTNNIRRSANPQSAFYPWPPGGMFYIWTGSQSCCCLEKEDG